MLVLLIGPPGLALRAERRGLAARLGISLRMTALLGAALTLAFVMVCRPEPSVLRAAACGLITLLAIATGRRRSLIPALAAAVLLLVLYDPWLARSYGFLLSVLATGALLTLAPRWSEALRRRGVPPRLAEALAAAGAAQAVCAPGGRRARGPGQPGGGPVQSAGRAGGGSGDGAGLRRARGGAGCRCRPPRCSPGARGCRPGWIASVARAGATLPGAETEWPGGWRGGLLLAVLTALVVLVARRLARKPWAAASCAVLLLLVVLRPPPLTRIVTGWPPPGWTYAMCDVGQGDATVLAAGAGSAVVVDAGPDPELVDDCLRDLGISRVPLLLLTHFHADHVTGLPGVLRGRSVGAIETTTLQEPREQGAFVRRTAAAAGVPVVRAAPGEQRRAGPLDWRVLWPRAGADEDPAAQAPNDSSVTLFVRIKGGLTLLLPGDLEPPAQQALLRDYPDLPRADVLKVAHHGSAFQYPGLLRAVRPRLALISCGSGNMYGHPSPRTVEALRAGGAVVLRTDTDGAIAVTGSGAGLRAVPRGQEGAVG